MYSTCKRQDRCYDIRKAASDPPATQERRLRGHSTRFTSTKSNSDITKRVFNGKLGDIGSRQRGHFVAVSVSCH